MIAFNYIWVVIFVSVKSLFISNLVLIPWTWYDSTGFPICSNPDQSKHLETARMRLFDVWIDVVNLRSEDYSENSRIPTMVLSFLINILYVVLLFWRLCLVRQFVAKGYELRTSSRIKNFSADASIICASTFVWLRVDQ